MALRLSLKELGEFPIGEIGVNVKVRVNLKNSSRGDFLGDSPHPSTLPSLIFKLREVKSEEKKRRKEKRRFIRQAITPTVEITPYTTQPILIKCKLCGHTILSPNPINVIVRAVRHYRYAHQTEISIRRFTISQLPKMLRLMRKYALIVVEGRNVNPEIRIWAEKFLEQLFELVREADHKMITKSLQPYYQVIKLTVADYQIIKWCLTKNRPRTNYILQSNRHPQLLAVIEEKRTKRGRIRHKLLKTVVVGSNRKLF